MKRIILLTALTIFFISSWGQTTTRLSFTAGPSINWMSTDNRDVNRQKAVMGYDFGIMGDVFFTENEHYSLHTGLQVINTGGNLVYQSGEPFPFSREQLDPGTEIKYHLRYLEVPLSLKLKTDEFHRAYYWGVFGLSALVNVGANATSDDNPRTFKRTNINDEINAFNVAMNVGVGFDFDLGGNNSVSAALIFQNGLMDVTTDNYFTDKTIVNSLKLRLGLIF